MVRMNIDFNEELTAGQIKMLEALKNSPAVPDEDCPELTDEQLKQMKRVSHIKAEEQFVTVELSPQAFEKAKSLGENYLTVLSKILESALKDNETIQRYL